MDESGMLYTWSSTRDSGTQCLPKVVFIWCALPALEALTILFSYAEFGRILLNLALH